jgi:ferrochelatase
MIGVLLMSFGTASGLDDIRRYLASVRGNATLTDDVVVEFRRRFAQVGGSPLIAITCAQAAALETLLNTDTEGEAYRVRVGMRHSAPFIAEGLHQLADCQRIVAIVMSPQYSPAIMGGYVRAVEEAQRSQVVPINVTVAGPWHHLDSFLDALAGRVRQGLERLPRTAPETTPVVFTAHSLPRKVAESEPGYIQQLKDTASEVATRAGLTPDRWTFAYQSAGHTRDEWLMPDVKDLLPDFRSRGYKAVLVAPVQFLADHLEVLYDIDIAACEEANRFGIKLSRIEMLNTDPGLIRALREVVGSNES